MRLARRVRRRKNKPGTQTGWCRRSPDQQTRPPAPGRTARSPRSRRTQASTQDLHKQTRGHHKACSAGRTRGHKPSSSSLQHSKRISKMNGSQNMHWLFLTLMKLIVTTLILLQGCSWLRRRQHRRGWKNTQKKRNTPKKSGPVQKSDRRNTLTEKTRGFVAQFRHIFNAKKQVWIVRAFTRFLTSTKKLSIQIIEENEVYHSADNVTVCGVEMNLKVLS